MKINPFLSIVSLLLAVLVSYAIYSYCEQDALRWLITICAGVSVFLTWAGTLAVSLADTRRTVNLRVLSGIFAVGTTCMQFGFAFSEVTTTTYILVSGVILFIWLVTAYSISRTKK